MTGNDEWSPDEALGEETFRQGDVAEDEDERLNPGFRELLEVDPSVDPTLVADELELEELGAQLDDPELMATLEGGIDDPDGIDGFRVTQLQRSDEGWDLGAPLVGASAGGEADTGPDEEGATRRLGVDDEDQS